VTRPVCQRYYHPTREPLRLVRCGALAVVTVAGIPMCRVHITPTIMELLDGSSAVRVEDVR